MGLYFVACSSKSLIAILGYDLDWNVSDSLIFTEIARLPNSTLFLLAQICSADKINWLERSKSTQRSRLISALL